MHEIRKLSRTERHSSQIERTHQFAVQRLTPGNIILFHSEHGAEEKILQALKREKYMGPT